MQRLYKITLIAVLATTVLGLIFYLNYFGITYQIQNIAQGKPANGIDIPDNWLGKTADPQTAKPENVQMQTPK
jgi:hypothetical protein